MSAENPVKARLDSYSAAQASIARTPRGLARPARPDGPRQGKGAVRQRDVAPPPVRARAEMRLAEEYDAAQERGEVGQSGQRTDLVSNGNEVIPSAADLGLARKDIHEARQLRDAERDNPDL